MERIGRLACLAPVGPFAGLSNGARQKIGDRFPTLSIVEIESAAKSFSTELRAPNVDRRLAEARNELNIFARELARFRAALSEIRRHRLDHAIGEAGRMIGGENELEHLEQSLSNLKAAIRQTSRALPFGASQLASRRLIETLARHVEQAGLPLGGTASHSLLGLVDLIFDDLMIGGDAKCAVREWHQSHPADVDRERASKLLDLVP